MSETCTCTQVRANNFFTIFIVFIFMRFGKLLLLKQAAQEKADEKWGPLHFSATLSTTGGSGWITDVGYFRKFIYCFGSSYPLGLQARAIVRSSVCFFVPTILLAIFTLFCLPSSVFMTYFNLAVPKRKCLGKYSCMSSTFFTHEKSSAMNIRTE